MIYLDWAATALPDHDVYQRSMDIALENPGNPSSIHNEGIKSKKYLEKMRESCAQSLGCKGQQLVLTSGGTESNNLVIFSQLNRAVQGEILISTLEHPSVMEAAKSLAKFGYKIKWIQPDERGIISPNKLDKKITEQTRMVFVMAVHNVTGVKQPIEELAAVVRQNEGQGKPIHFHSDMVQAAGKMEIDLAKMDVDSASFSGHKTGAPRGCGLLYLKKPIPTLHRGGGQERGLRPGTESLQNMAAMAMTLEKHSDPALLAPYKDMSSRLISHLRKAVPQVVFNPAVRETEQELFVPHIINFSIPPIPGEVLHRILNDVGIALSHGSACAANGHKKPEDLHSMGIHPKTAHCSVRISLGSSTTEDELDRFTAVLKEQVEQLGIL